MKSIHFFVSKDIFYVEDKGTAYFQPEFLVETARCGL